MSSNPSESHDVVPRVGISRGAGKSTSFKILTREVDRTGGDVELLGLDADDNQNQISKEMGYCPQEDVLFDLLTVEEHLHFYASLRGLVNR